MYSEKSNMKNFNKTCLFMKHLLYWSGLSILKLPFLISIIHNKHASDKGSYQPLKE